MLVQKAGKETPAQQNTRLRAELAARDEQINHLFRHSGREGSEDYDAVEVSAAWARLRQPVGKR